MSAATATSAQKKEKVSLLATIGNNARQYGIVGALLVIVIAFEILTGGVLLKPNSFVSLIQQNAYVIILAIGMVMVIIATHIDLSVGSLVAFIGGVCALLMERAGMNWMLAILLSLIVGLIVGVWQGFWVAYVGIPGFITTLAGMLMFRGLATVIVGESVPITSNAFRGIARDYLPNILGFWGPFDGLTLVVGVLCIVGYAFSQLRKRKRVEKVGLVPEPCSVVTSTPSAAIARQPSSPVSTPSASTSCCSSIWASSPLSPRSACCPVWPPRPHRPAWSSKWTPSLPASSAVRPSPAVSARFRGQWSAHS